MSMDTLMLYYALGIPRGHSDARDSVEVDPEREAVMGRRRGGFSLLSVQLMGALFGCTIIQVVLLPDVSPPRCPGVYF
jgi:hypothetical protein